MLGVVHGVGDVLACLRQALIDLPDSCGDGGSEERGTCLEHPFRYGTEVVGNLSSPLIPVVGGGVMAGLEGFTDSGRSPAETDVAVGADRVGEFGETTMLTCGLERGPVWDC